MSGRYRGGAAAIGVSVHWRFRRRLFAMRRSRRKTRYHVAHSPEQAVLGEGGVVVESDRSSQMRIDAAEHRKHR